MAQFRKTFKRLFEVSAQKMFKIANVPFRSNPGKLEQYVLRRKSRRFLTWSVTPSKLSGSLMGNKNSLLKHVDAWTFLTITHILFDWLVLHVIDTVVYCLYFQMEILLQKVVIVKFYRCAQIKRFYLPLCRIFLSQCFSLKFKSGFILISKI